MANDFHECLVALASSIDLRKTLNKAALGESVALAVAPHGIPINLAIAAILILAIEVAADFHLSLAGFVSIFETCSIDLRQTLNTAALGAPVTLVAAPHKIPINLAVAVAVNLAMAVAVYFHQSFVDFFETCSTVLYRTCMHGF